MGVIGLRRTTEPKSDPVTVEDLVKHFRLRAFDEDERTYLNGQIPAARGMVERFLGRALITQSWTMTLDAWPGGERDWWDAVHTPRTTPSSGYLELPYPPLESVTSVTTYDDSDTATAITVATYFYVDTNSEPGRLVLRAGQNWPIDTRAGAKGKIIYVAGYGGAGEDVPAQIRLGIMTLALWLYENRGDKVARNPLGSSGAAGILESYRVLSL